MPKDNRGTKARVLEEFKFSDIYSYKKKKNNTINIAQFLAILTWNHTIKAFRWVITLHIMFGFQQKIARYAKWPKETVSRDKVIFRTRHRYDTGDLK